jgi:hypothetical protein
LRACSKEQEVGSYISDLFLHRSLRALSDADHGNDCGYTNDDAKHRQSGTRLVAPKGANGNSKNNQEIHFHSPCLNGSYPDYGRRQTRSRLVVILV